jgi:hypothetical protein
MAGYEHQILEMFRGSNPGLSSRFDADFPWRFADFSDDDLLEVAVAYVQSPKRDLSALVRTDVIRHMVQKVSKQRALHNFGNARAIETVRTTSIRSFCTHAFGAVFSHFPLLSRADNFESEGKTDHPPSRCASRKTRLKDHTHHYRRR